MQGTIRSHTQEKRHDRLKIRPPRLSIYFKKVLKRRRGSIQADEIIPQKSRKDPQGHGHEMDVSRRDNVRIRRSMCEPVEYEAGTYRHRRVVSWPSETELTQD